VHDLLISVFCIIHVVFCFGFGCFIGRIIRNA